MPFLRVPPREAEPFTRYFELCECSDSVIVLRFAADHNDFPLRISPPRRSKAKSGFSLLRLDRLITKLGALQNEILQRLLRSQTDRISP